MKTLLDHLDIDVVATTTVVTANQRLTRALRAAFDARQQGAGQTVWESPDILPWSGWMQRLGQQWQEVDPVAPELLSDWQSRAVWEPVIAAAEADRPLLNLSATAKAAFEAWGLAHEWRLPLPLPEPLADDPRAFQRWVACYRDRCRTQGWSDAARLPDHLIAAVPGGGIDIPARLVLAGFDRLSPRQEALFQALESQGCALIRHRPDTQERGRAQRIELPDGATELKGAAHWARAWVEQGASRVGIVLPDLGNRLDAVEATFTAILAPETLLPGSDPDAPRPFNLSLGRPLAFEPVIHTALGILALARGKGELFAWGDLLRAPFWQGGATEAIPRALLEAALRRRRATRLGLGAVMAAAQGDEQRGLPPCPILAQTLAGLRAVMTEQGEGGSPALWAQRFGAWLTRAGWPGEQTLTSREYQAVQRWRRTLEQLASLEAVAPRMSLGEGLSWLRRLALETLFQPETPEVPVQILGPLEAEGLDFDAVWVGGLSDEVWPPQPSPNPFLPVELQRRLKMPRASQTEEGAFAAELTQRWLHTAPEIVMSWPAHEGDRELRPSPLILGVPLGTPPKIPQESVDVSACSPYAEETRPIPTGEQVEGGSQLFADQAACPFRAFARHRLAARSLETPEEGLDARHRGDLVHAVLEHFWRVVGSQERLLALDVAGLEEQVAQAVDAAVAAFAERAPELLPPRLSRVERKRLTRLVVAWLDLERTRAPFTVVASEGGGRGELGGIAFNVRIDRIDRLEDGGLVILDYKTGGQKKPQDWFGDRPNDPQLPLYAVTLQGEVAGLGYAQVRLGDSKFAGLADREGVAPGVGELAQSRLTEVTDWHAQLAAWRATLEGLATNFREGVATVDPKEGGKSCQYCDLAGLCRIHEVGMGTEALEGEGHEPEIG